MFIQHSHLLKSIACILDGLGLKYLVSVPLKLLLVDHLFNSGIELGIRKLFLLLLLLLLSKVSLDQFHLEPALISHIGFLSKAFTDQCLES